MHIYIYESLMRSIDILKRQLVCVVRHCILLNLLCGRGEYCMELYAQPVQFSSAIYNNNCVIWSIESTEYRLYELPFFFLLFSLFLFLFLVSNSFPTGELLRTYQQASGRSTSTRIPQHIPPYMLGVFPFVVCYQYRYL